MKIKKGCHNPRVKIKIQKVYQNEKKKNLQEIK